MSIFRNKRVGYWQVAQELRKELNLDFGSEVKIKEYLEQNYTVMEFDPKKKSRFLARLTGPLYMIYWCLLVIGMPIKYIFTGRMYYNDKGFVYRSIKWWGDKLAL